MEDRADVMREFGRESVSEAMNEKRDVPTGTERKA